MDSLIKTLRAYEDRTDVLSLMKGSPGPATLKDCRDIILKATSYVLDQETCSVSDMFSYGDSAGDEEFREELARFLTQEYGDTVQSSNLMVTAGATQALQMIASVLFTKDSVVFIEDPTYFAAQKMLHDDLQMNVVPVPCDADGIVTDVLDDLLTKHRPKEVGVTQARPFWAMLYTIPVFNNPTGRCHSTSRCRRLVELARKHDVLLVAEDIYNLVYFGESTPPARLLSYDNPSDPDYRGHTLSVGTFSKILAPSLRLGWVEAPDRILQWLYGSNMIWSGGSLNHYTSKLASAALKLGLEIKHLRDIRHIYMKRNNAVCQVLKNNLPEGSTFVKPQGGFFVWVELPKELDTFELMKWMVDKYEIFFMPGIFASIRGNFGHCIRVSISYYEEDILVDAIHKLCKGTKEFIHLQTNAAA